MTGLRPLAAVLALGLAAVARGEAQDTVIVIHPESSVVDESRDLPRDVAADAVRLFNAPTTTRLVGRTRVPAGNGWQGDVGVRTGAITLAGRITGTLLVINGDATLEETAEVTGDVIVIGGTFARAPGARVGGRVAVYREPLSYRTDGDLIALTQNPKALFPFLGAHKTWEGTEARSTLTVATAGTFNRVEGLPIVFGPQSEWQFASGPRLRVDILGLARSVGSVGGEPGDLGYLVNVDLRSTPRDAPAFGVRLGASSVVAPIEDWGLHDAEVGWAAFLFQRDYRDYYFTRGGQGGLYVQPVAPLTLSLDVRRDWETSVDTRDPWSVIRYSGAWRLNPPIDAGHYTTLRATVTFDTRNDPDQPTVGWLLTTHVDNGWSGDVTPQLLPVGVRAPIPTDGSYEFTRFMLDVRRYTRISPTGRVNLRLFASGWLGGDPLPLQQRLSLGGADPLPGYGFRESACNSDITAPVFDNTSVAACDRVIVTQVEYRGHLSLHWSYQSAHPENELAKSLFTLLGPDLVVFGDGGQAWLVGTGPGRLPGDRLPALGSWLADLGLGIDWSGFGIYLAKGVTAGEPFRITVRLDHRF
ncbi:MAG TPA: BamA/TamA family outer membrane protein [Gemmatimonadales bacterium]|nr:BamA/TamA family outer membrane protein [Gemmatimonadales bacterium]